MTDASVAPDQSASYYPGRLPPRRLTPTVVLSAALVSALLAGAITFGTGPTRAPRSEQASTIEATGTIALPAQGPLLDAAFLSGAPLDPLPRTLPLASDFVYAEAPLVVASAEPAPESAAPTAPERVAAEDIPPAEASPAVIPAPPVPAVVASVPLPLPRPTEIGTELPRGPVRGNPRRLALETAAPTPTTIPPDRRSFFEKLFGMAQPSGPALGYAAPEDGGRGNFRFSPRRPLLASNRSTAVYDIAAHTVTMPDGTRLEAHSGLGPLLDDPRYVHARNRGPTPPAVYDLGYREQLFHGVQALRLTPLNSGVYGRTGLLAHTYMLGPNGDSNGCVSFKDYSAFLRAFSNGEVKRLMVVAGGA